MKKTKIIATISNQVCNTRILKELHKAGMDAVRLNTAYLTLKDAFKVIQNVRAVSNRIAIIVDTKGPEIRINTSNEAIPVKTGEVIHIKGDRDRSSSAECLYVDYPGFVDELGPGDSILIDDGEIELSVHKKIKGVLKCIVKNDGAITSHKSINLPSVKISKLPSLSGKDKRFVKFAMEHDVDFIAHSFVRRKEDVLAIQEILDTQKSSIKIIAKIENQEGVENIDHILKYAYGVMIDRGDLAIEIPAEKIPIIQKNLVKKCIERRKPVIIATQMLQSMIHSPRPTRAEVSDVANACIDRTDAVMLSGETAIGKYPLESVKMMATIADEVESSIRTFVNVSYESENSITSYLAKAAVKASMRLDTKALVADSISGKTILNLAAYRGESLIYAQCYSKQVMRHLAISFGVYSDYMTADMTAQVSQNCHKAANEEKAIKKKRFDNYSGWKLWVRQRCFICGDQYCQ
ncbi:MAG: pyruvate kinase [Nitrospinales bacterium]